MPRKKRWQQRVYTERLDEVEQALKKAKGYSLSDAVSEALENWCRVKEAEYGGAFPENPRGPRRGRWRDTERNEPTDARLSVSILEPVLERFYRTVAGQEHPNDYVGNALDDALEVWVRYRKLIERQQNPTT